MLMSKGVAHALDYDFRLVSLSVMAPLQRRLERGLRQTMSVLLRREVSELAWERAKFSRALGVWASGWPRWVLWRKQRAGRLSIFAQGSNGKLMRSTEQTDTRAAS